MCVKIPLINYATLQRTLTLIKIVQDGKILKETQERLISFVKIGRALNSNENKVTLNPTVLSRICYDTGKNPY